MMFSDQLPPPPPPTQASVSDASVSDGVPPPPPGECCAWLDSKKVPMVRIEHTRASETALWASKINGAPYIPKLSGTHPKAWRLLVQINFADIPKPTENWSGINGLPEKGLLQIWWYPHSYDLCETGVVFYEDVISDVTQLHTTFPQTYMDAPKGTPQGQSERGGRDLGSDHEDDKGLVRDVCDEANDSHSLLGLIPAGTEEMGSLPIHVRSSMFSPQGYTDTGRLDEVLKHKADADWYPVASCETSLPYELKFVRDFDVPNFTCRDVWSCDEELINQLPDHVERTTPSDCPSTSQPDHHRAPPSAQCKIGGYPYFAQCDSEERPEIHLLQIGSFGDVAFGDSGLAHWFIDEQDLVKKKFENLYFMWDCC